MFESNDRPHAPTIEKVNEEKHHEETALISMNDVELAKNQDFQEKFLYATSSQKKKNVMYIRITKNFMYDKKNIKNVSPKDTEVLNKDKKFKIKIMLSDPDEKINSGIRMKENIDSRRITTKKLLSERVVVKSIIYDKQHMYESNASGGTISARNYCDDDNPYNTKRANEIKYNNNCENCFDLLSTMKKEVDDRDRKNKDKDKSEVEEIINKEKKIIIKGLLELLNKQKKQEEIPNEKILMLTWASCNNTPERNYQRKKSLFFFK
ncbi:hypothetical protein RFI_07605 [Reticulomyxa filosa]|uniref:Uncharacterized protein n=1 Tax=Reticulomyxa filosa TaxID=46433 RepID=X6NTB3_RETFI|nr:hypothetical protein RFI_07605 [Reticulomyxa filosa]|eukprot:ETO29515.1 hypothetical protein RFI_07605 [Reticulomyxa filosa]